MRVATARLFKTDASDAAATAPPRAQRGPDEGRFAAFRRGGATASGSRRGPPAEEGSRPGGSGSPHTPRLAGTEREAPRTSPARLTRTASLSAGAATPSSSLGHGRSRAPEDTPAPRAGKASRGPGSGSPLRAGGLPDGAIFDAPRRGGGRARLASEGGQPPSSPQAHVPQLTGGTPPHRRRHYPRSVPGLARPASLGAGGAAASSSSCAAGGLPAPGGEGDPAVLLPPPPPLPPLSCSQPSHSQGRCACSSRRRLRR